MTFCRLFLALRAQVGASSGEHLVSGIIDHVGKCLVVSFYYAVVPWEFYCCCLKVYAKVVTHINDVVCPLSSVIN